jgi:hypothetical protein
MFRARWRKWLRERTPTVLYERFGLVVPKVPDCGNHEWHHSQHGWDACYHCRATRPRPTGGDAP